MRSFIFRCLIGLILAKSCYAVSTNAVPCSPVKVKALSQSIILENANPNPQIFFLKNTSKKSIWLDHPVKKAGAGAGWSSYLRPGNWSAILLDNKEFAITCSVIQPGKVDALGCGKAISVCLSHLPLPHSSRKGSFWLIEDKPVDEMLKDLSKRLAKH